MRVLVGDAPDADTAEALRAGAGILMRFPGNVLAGSCGRFWLVVIARTLVLMREWGVLDAIYAGDWDVDAYGIWAGVDDARAPMLALAVMLRALLAGDAAAVAKLGVRLKLSRHEWRDLQTFCDAP